MQIQITNKDTKFFPSSLYIRNSGDLIFIYDQIIATTTNKNNSLNIYNEVYLFEIIQ